MKDCTLIHGNCLDVMRRAPKASVNLVLADLPYGTTANKWDAVIPFNDMWEGFLRVAKETAAFVLTASQPFTSALVMSQPSLFKCEWIWRKDNVTGHLNAKRFPMKEHESIIVFARSSTIYNPQGLQPFNKMKRRTGHGNGACYGKSKSEYFQEVTNYPRTVLEFSTVRDGIHPTQKPVDLMRYMIRTYSNPGDVILDPTMGSGTTGLAAMLEVRKFIGIEQNKEYYDIATSRLSS